MLLAWPRSNRGPYMQEVPGIWNDNIAAQQFF
jgi:hypothetical protein